MAVAKRYYRHNGLYCVYLTTYIARVPLPAQLEWERYGEAERGEEESR